MRKLLMSCGCVAEIEDHLLQDPYLDITCIPHQGTSDNIWLRQDEDDQGISTSEAIDRA